jgi:3-oxoadipate enol-lactonase
MSAVIIDGGVVHYEYLGRGKPIMFIHGWLGSWRYWMSTMGDLSDSYRTYALDLWGFGDSDKQPGRYSLNDYVQLIMAFMDEMGLVRIPLFVGHTLGAVVALEIAATRPEMVERLALVSLPLEQQAIETRSLCNGRSIFSGGLFKKPTEEYEPVVREMDKTDRQAIELSLSSLNGLDVASRLFTLRVPTLVIHGARDPIIAAPQDNNAPILETLSAQTRLVRAMVMPQARHFPMLEEANTFNRLLRDFLLLDVSDPEQIHSLQFKEEWRRRMR